MLGHAAQRIIPLRFVLATGQGFGGENRFTNGQTNPRRKDPRIKKEIADQDEGLQGIAPPGFLRSHRWLKCADP